MTIAGGTKAKWCHGCDVFWSFRWSAECWVCGAEGIVVVRAWG